MMNTGRATTGISNWGFGLAGDPRQSTAITGVCQDRRKSLGIQQTSLALALSPFTSRIPPFVERPRLPAYDAHRRCLVEPKPIASTGPILHPTWLPPLFTLLIR